MLRKGNTMKNIWRNKKVPWKWISVGKEEYNKPFFFHYNPVPNNKWMWHPRAFIWINLFLISFWRDNSNVRIGIGFGRTQYSINYHH
jgi:hypothetical protein